MTDVDTKQFFVANFLCFFFVPFAAIAWETWRTGVLVTRL